MSKGKVLVPRRFAVQVGYRRWNVYPKGNRRDKLYASTVLAQRTEKPWEPDGPTKAVCRYHYWHEAPVWECSCGLYAYYEPHQVLQNMARHPFVLGSVLAFGHTIHHKNKSFFRAEQALPIALLDPWMYRDLPRYSPWSWRPTTVVARKLGLPLFETLEEVAHYTERQAERWTLERFV